MVLMQARIAPSAMHQNPETLKAPVAQLDRASDFGSEGWGFESLPVYDLLPLHPLTGRCPPGCLDVWEGPLGLWAIFIPARFWV